MFDWYIILGIALLVPIAYFMMRRNHQARDDEEQDEERWAESLTDADVQDIYGDKEDRWKDDE